MKKIDLSNVQMGFEKLPVGGYVCAVKTVTDVPDKEYLKIEFDIVKGDKKGWYKKQYDTDTRENKKWSGTLCRSYKEAALPMFKGWITSLEESNANFKWDGEHEQSMVNKYFGAVMGEEEYLNGKGQLRTRVVPVGIHSVKTIESGDFKIPELKKLDNSASVSNTSKVDLNDLFGGNNTTEETTTIEKAPTIPTECPFDIDEENPFA